MSNYVEVFKAFKDFERDFLLGKKYNKPLYKMILSDYYNALKGANNAETIEKVFL